MANEKDILDTRKTRKKYRGKLVRPSWALEQAEGRTRTAGNALIFIAAFQILPSLFHYITDQILLDALIVQLVIGAIFIGCFFLSRKQPIAAFAIALIVFWGILALVHLVFGVPFSQGILWTLVFSGIILAGLGNAIYTNVKREELKRLEVKHPEDVEVIEY